MLQESGQLVFDERVDGENRKGRMGRKERYNAWPCLLPPVGECISLSLRCPHHPEFPSSRWRNNVSHRCQARGTSSSRHRRSQHIRRRVSLITDRPLFINGELVSTFTYARISAITHHHHARAGVSGESPRGTLPATSPRNASQGHRGIT